MFHGSSPRWLSFIDCLRCLTPGRWRGSRHYVVPCPGIPFRRWGAHPVGSPVELVTRGRHVGSRHLAQRVTGESVTGRKAVLVIWHPSICFGPNQLCCSCRAVVLLEGSIAFGASFDGRGRPGGEWRVARERERESC